MFWIHVQHVDLRAARKFTGTWSSYTHHAAVSSPNYLGAGQKGKSHDLIKKNLSILFFSMIYHNVYRLQAMIIPDALNIKKGDFYCHSHLLLLSFSS